MHTEKTEDELNYHESVTSHSYTYHSQIGHGINGPSLQLINLEESTDLNEQVALIAAAFYEVIAERK